MLKGRLKFPGDKSISHRALIFAAMTNGKCHIENISTGKDVEATRNCLGLCGIDSGRTNNSISIIGGQLNNPKTNLDCGNSGTTARLLVGLLAGKRVNANFIGDKSLSRRPMQRIIDPLNKMGAGIESVNQRLPLTLPGNILRGISYTLPVASAQVKSAILLAGLGAEDDTTVIEPISTRNHTELILNELGVDVRIKENSITVSPLQKSLQSFVMNIPGDPSSATFFAAAATILQGSDLILENISVNPSRTGFYVSEEKYRF